MPDLASRDGAGDDIDAGADPEQHVPDDADLPHAALAGAGFGACCGAPRPAAQ